MCDSVASDRTVRVPEYAGGERARGGHGGQDASRACEAARAEPRHTLRMAFGGGRLGRHGSARSVLGRGRRHHEDTIPSSVFGLVHGAVRRCYQCLEGFALRTHLGHTEARRELDVPPFEMDDGLLHLLSQTFRELIGILGVRVWQENGELLTAYASRDIRLPTCFGHDPGQVLEHFVPTA